LLVVADRARRGAHSAGDLADAQRGRGRDRGAHDLGLMSDTAAPTSDVAASTHSAVCMLWMKGSSCTSLRPDASPEKILQSTSWGTEEVTIARTKAIESTAPVFWSITRAPAATPRRYDGTVPITAAVLGELNMPEPMPTRPSQIALCQY